MIFYDLKLTQSVNLSFQKGLPTMNVLHISDLHWDRMYMEGTNAECGEPLCCRSNDGPPGSIDVLKVTKANIRIKHEI